MLAVLTRQRLAVAICAFVVCGCANRSIPREFPTHEPGKTVDVVVVARTSAGGYLPQFPECAGPDVLCMDPPPFWFWAKVSHVAFGDVQGSRRLAVSTTSHYGIEGTLVEDEHILARLRFDGTSFVMPRYARARLTQRRDGELVILVWSSSPIWWLPCETMNLVEAIVDSDYAESIAGDPAYFSDEELKAEAGYLKKTAEGIMPKYAIPVSKLSKTLTARFASGQLPSCEANP